MSKFKNIATDLIVTCFFIGRIKYAPGTLGSLLAFPINYILVICVVESRYLLPLDRFSEFERELITILSAIFLAIILLFFIGVKASNAYVRRTGREDPSEIVIDETVGQMLTCILTLPTYFVVLTNYMNTYSRSLIEVVTLFLMPFLLFRIFDIVKPWPIGWVDKNVKGGFGIMIDDVLAAVFASIFQYALICVFV